MSNINKIAEALGSLQCRTRHGQRPYRLHLAYKTQTLASRPDRNKIILAEPDPFTQARVERFVQPPSAKQRTTISTRRSPAQNRLHPPSPSLTSAARPPVQVHTTHFSLLRSHILFTSTTQYPVRSQYYAPPPPLIFTFARSSSRSWSPPPGS